MKFLKTLLALALAAATLTALADEASIRKNLAERIPQLKQIDEVNKTAVPGLFEIRVNGTEIFYVDADANHLFQGNLIDTKKRRNLTEERVEKLTMFPIPFDSLPMKDGFTIVRGNGARKMAVFEDPNCGFCKQFEAGLQNVNNVTITMFLLPVLGPKSVEKSKDIWCAKDRGKVWQDYMVRDHAIPPVVASGCDISAIARNLEFAKKYKITGTPTVVFADGSRVPGSMPSAQVEKYLTDIKN